ncbi:MAG: hypothetical protein ACREAR_03020 [Nitrosotalea sp.]
MKYTLLITMILSVLVLVPIAISYSTSSPSQSSTCATSISQQENQTVTLDLQKKSMYFIENNTTEFKSLSQKYHVAWLGTSYDWNTNLSTCTATLNGITATFELSNSTSPFVGESHITIDPLVTKVTSVKSDIPNVVVPPTCTDQACRSAHGILN